MASEADSGAPFETSRIRNSGFSMPSRDFDTRSGVGTVEPGASGPSGGSPPRRAGPGRVRVGRLLLLMV